MHRNLDRSYHLAMSHRGMGAVEKVQALARVKAIAEKLCHARGLQNIAHEGRGELVTV
jgi:hypothetical protein